MLRLNRFFYWSPLALAVACGGEAGVPADPPSDSVGQDIKRGRDMSDAEAANSPVVSVDDGSGVVLDEHHILTAAHVVHNDKPSEIKIIQGTPADPIEYFASAYYKHHDYIPGKDHIGDTPDLAVIYVAKVMPGPYAAPACGNGQGVVPDEVLVESGQHKVTVNGKTNLERRKNDAKLPVWQKSAKGGKQFNYRDNLLGQHTMGGDSGSGVYRSGTRELLGIHSYGNDEFFYDTFKTVHTGNAIMVRKYCDWIGFAIERVNENFLLFDFDGDGYPDYFGFGTYADGTAYFQIGLPGFDQQIPIPFLQIDGMVDDLAIGTFTDSVLPDLFGMALAVLDDGTLKSPSFDTQTVQSFAPADGSTYQGVQAAHLDDDGYSDLALFTTRDKLEIFKGGPNGIERREDALATAFQFDDDWVLDYALVDGAFVTASNGTDAPARASVGITPTQIVSGAFRDLGGDLPGEDIVVVGEGKIIVCESDSHGGFVSPCYEVDGMGGTPVGLSVSDANSDGRDDLHVIFKDGSTFAYHSSGALRFSSTRGAWVWAMRGMDWDDDGLEDFVISSVGQSRDDGGAGAGEVALNLGNGEIHHFNLEYVPDVTPPGTANDLFGMALAWGDFDPDIAGHEFAVSAGNVTNASGNDGIIAYFSSTVRALNPATAGVPDKIALKYYATELAAGDFNGDGVDDLVAKRSHWSSEIDLFRGGPGGLTDARRDNFSPAQLGLEQRSGTKLATGDFNCDGFEDLAITGLVDAENAYAVATLSGSANGLDLATRRFTFVDRTPAAIAAGNFNGKYVDGKPCIDLAVSHAYEPDPAGGRVSPPYQVRILNGSPGGFELDGPVIRTDQSDDTRVGRAMTVTSLDEDSFDDLLIGTATGDGAGAAYVAMGGPEGPSTTLLRLTDPVSWFESFPSLTPVDGPEGLGSRVGSLATGAFLISENGRDFLQGGSVLSDVGWVVAIESSGSRDERGPATALVPRDAIGASTPEGLRFGYRLTSARPGLAGYGTALHATDVHQVLKQSSETLGGEIAARAWEAGTAFAVGAESTYRGVLWTVRQAHVAQIGWEPPNVPALWERAAVTGVGSWQSQTPYGTGDHALYDGTEYQCLQGHTSLDGWQPPNVPALWSTVMDPPVGGGGIEDWQDGGTYAVGDQVAYQGASYECLQAHTAWLGAGWVPPVVSALWKLLQ